MSRIEPDGQARVGGGEPVDRAAIEAEVLPEVVADLPHRDRRAGERIASVTMIVRSRPDTAR
jgi:hypothetical protein